ncbi:chromate efflux transporter [Flavobacterium sp.]|uniref:chromate efflux transporter n=1 Tax=Flavobacterium sp. TaxID=239 RepID=UPI002604735E|nr:chromate efflux transporter [Flavobacterium sp.]
MSHSLKEVIQVFARLGITAFGGPAAHIAMMRQEVVNRRRWMDDAAFLDLLGATNLIPGPNSTEMAIHLGKHRAGWKGLLMAGILFIVPAVLITVVIAWLYKEYGSLPQVQPFIYGIKPAIIAVIIFAVFPLAKASVKNNLLAIIAVIAVVAALLGLHEIIVLFGAGALYAALTYGKDRLMLLQPLLLAATLSETRIFIIFLKIGAILYGSGYVLFAFIETELVDKGFLTTQQLADAIAVGQFTPGPVFSSVTFIGYQLNGFSGALAATAGVFLPSFVFVALISRIVPKIRTSKLFAAFLDAVNAASVAVIASVCWQMGRESIVSWQAALIFIVSILLFWLFPKINSALIVVFGSFAGWLLYML